MLCFEICISNTICAKLTSGPGTEGNVDIQLNRVWFESYYGIAPNVPSNNNQYIPVEAL